MDEKAQGALEYLLLIGGAVLVAAIVIVLLSGLTGTPLHASEQANAKLNIGYSSLNAQAK